MYLSPSLNLKTEAGSSSDMLASYYNNTVWGQNTENHNMNKNLYLCKQDKNMNT